MLNRVKFKQKDITMTLAKVMPIIRMIIGTALLASFLFPYEKPLMFQFMRQHYQVFKK